MHRNVPLESSILECVVLGMEIKYTFLKQLNFLLTNTFTSISFDSMVIMVKALALLINPDKCS